MDAGIVSEANIARLRERGCQWIVVDSRRCPAVPEREPDRSLRTSDGHRVRVWSSAADDEVRLRLLSRGREHTERSINDAHRLRLEEALVRLREGLTMPRRLKRHEAVLDSIGRFKERFSRVANQYRIAVVKDPQDPNAVDITCTPKESYYVRDRAAGHYQLRYNLTDWDNKRIVRTYWSLTQVEETFRSLKTELGLRPIHHKLERCVRAHLFVTVLSYLAAHALRFRLRQAGEFRSWSFLCAALRPMVRATYAAKDKNGQRESIRLNSEPNDDQRQMLRRLGMRSRRKIEWIVLPSNKM